MTAQPHEQCPTHPKDVTSNTSNSVLPTDTKVDVG